MLANGVCKKLIEVALPLDAINEAASREKSIRHGHPSTLHLWWSRKPLAAARAVLFGQLVDDPGSWVDSTGKPSHPDLYNFASEGEERERLFAVIRELVIWENSNDERVIGNARLEIAKSIARCKLREGNGDADDRKILQQPSREEVDKYVADKGPLVLDPFAGGGSIPLEAQRLGLKAQAQDLNPVAVLINKAMIEIPPKFAGKAPVHPEARRASELKSWKAAQGLAEDIRHYGEWMRDEAQKRIGHLYPKVRLGKEHGGGEATVIAWLWCRTVPSPNPALGGAAVPLMSTYWLSKKKGKEAWLEPVVDKKNRTWRFEVMQRGVNGVGAPEDVEAIERGTKVGRGAFKCLLSDASIPASYRKLHGQTGSLRTHMIAVVAKGQSSRIYLCASDAQRDAASCSKPANLAAIEQCLPHDPRAFAVVSFGLTRHCDLFTPRQLVALSTFSDLVKGAREQALADARAAGMEEGKPLSEGGSGAVAYADSIATYLAMATDRIADYNSSLVTWQSVVAAPVHTFTRQALTMTWDFAETNPFGTSTGGWLPGLERPARYLQIGAISETVLAGRARLTNAIESYPLRHKQVLFSTDPPYYDNIGYADLSDFFYVWLRRSLRDVHPELFKTALTPKDDELIASPYRHEGSKQKAELFFLEGMQKALSTVADRKETVCPTAIYYAFKQSEVKSGDVTSTGWATFLQGLVDGGFTIDGTWPLRTELKNRTSANDANSLASSVVLSCRKRDANTPATTRREFSRTLVRELPKALLPLQQANIAPVDMAQAAIGPGMAIFSRYSKVLEADGSAMSMRTALALVNKALDGHLAEHEGEMDADTRFALTWFKEHGYGYGDFGTAETLANARNVSVQGVKEAGIIALKAGKVRLLRREELDPAWKPSRDVRPTVWECLQHAIHLLEHEGEQRAAELMQEPGYMHEAVHGLAYQLYQVCERKGESIDARAYNSLIVAWDDLMQLGRTAQQRNQTQHELFERKASVRPKSRSILPQRDSQIPGGL